MGKDDYKVMKNSSADVVTVMRGVVESGTDTAPISLSGPVAGKTVPLMITLTFGLGIPHLCDGCLDGYTGRKKIRRTDSGVGLAVLNDLKSSDGQAKETLIRRFHA